MKRSSGCKRAAGVQAGLLVIGRGSAGGLFGRLHQLVRHYPAVTVLHDRRKRLFPVHTIARLAASKRIRRPCRSASIAMHSTTFVY